MIGVLRQRNFVLLWFAGLVSLTRAIGYSPLPCLSTSTA